jgi:hypothetical protein
MLEILEEQNPPRPDQPKRKVLVPAAKFRNPTAQTVRMRFVREQATLAGHAPPGWDPSVHGPRAHHPQRVLDIEVPPGETCTVPLECAADVHITECRRCTIDKLYCRRPEHRDARVIVGGQGPMLLRVLESGEDEFVPVHSALTAEAAAPPLNPADLASIHARTLARLAKTGAGAR